ncbi:hypothetical protein ACJIZ3_014697 [Penstemon smallii]|uniref:Pentatricopeptide repeat-containing protein n=1 Tax=Penstemon smallii TaxID=265156 RepID=A0ABD3RKA7_9LAMI
MNAYFYGRLKLHKKFNVFLSIKTCTAHFFSLTAVNPHSDSFSIPEKFASYLEKCSDTNSLKKLHACVITQGLEQNLLVGSKLLISFAKFNLLAESKWVLNKFIIKNLSLWDSIIVGYFRASQYDEVLGLYLNLRKKNIGIHSSAIIFGLKSCVKFGVYEFGRNLHTDAFKFGLSYDKFVGSSLIGFYCECDEILQAAKVFDEITDKDVVVYTSMVTGYAQVGHNHTNTAFRVVQDMQRDGFEPNRVTLVSLLQCALQLGSLEKGKSIHGYAMRRGIGCLDEVFETSVMDMYIKCGDPIRGATIFDKMNKKTTASWNGLIAGHLQLGKPLEALDLFRQMVHNKYELDLIALANGLLICAEMGHLLIGKSFHCHKFRQEINLDLVGNTALIDMYSKCKHLHGAMNIFYRTEDKDGVLYNVMISSYLSNGCVIRARDTFREMVNVSIRPNASTIISVLSTLSEMGDVRTGKCIHGYVLRQGLESNTDIGNQFIHMYAKCGFIGLAKQIFDMIKIKDRVSWTSMMTALVNQGLAHEAITLFRLMRKVNLHPDSITFTSLLQALNQVGSVILVREVHGHLYRVFLEKDVALMNSLITIYSKHGKIKLATILFELMGQRDLSSWNTMIAAYGMHGDCVQALKLFNQMKKENFAPDRVTFKSILSACSHTGFVKEGLCVFRSMEEEYGIVPSSEHYGCVVDLLGRAGQLEEAYHLLKSVPLRQNVSSLGALLAACRIHGNSEMGERVGKWLLDMEPWNTSTYCSMSNLHAGGGKWDEVAKIEAIAEGKGLKRTPGYSFVDLN